MKCWHCGSDLIWGGDHDWSVDDPEEQGIVTNLSCSNDKCKTYVEVYHYIKVKEESSEIDWTCDICDEDTSKVNYDYIGSGTNHLSCELQKAHEAEECSTQQPMNWIEGMSRERKGTWPGLDKILGGWIYESPDGGETIYKRPFMDYNPENRIKLTKEQWKIEKEK